MNNLKTRYNPFTLFWEVYELENRTDNLQFARVLHQFENMHDALRCKERLKYHFKLFDMVA